jgi:hypothetical protein
MKNIIARSLLTKVNYAIIGLASGCKVQGAVSTESAVQMNPTKLFMAATSTSVPKTNGDEAREAIIQA